jgi:Uma2 family endonuclease
MSLAHQPHRMTFDEYLTWSSRQEHGRYEYIDGEVVVVPAEGADHNLVKLALAIVLRDAIKSAGFAGQAFTDGMTVKIRGGQRGREPDAAVTATPLADRKSLVLPDPLIVAEAVSPNSERDDTGDKLDEYFSVPSIQHYLIVRPEKKLIVHHARGEGAALRTTFVTGPALLLDPPGLTVDLAPVYAECG